MADVEAVFESGTNAYTKRLIDAQIKRMKLKDRKKELDHETAKVEGKLMEVEDELVQLEKERNMPQRLRSVTQDE